MPEIASGQTTIFKQTTSLVGWTKVTSYDDYALRIVTGSVSTGGSINFSTVLSSVVPSGAVTGANTGNTTLTTSQIPSHTHDSVWAFPYTAASTGGPFNTPNRFYARAIMTGTSDGGEYPIALGGSGTNPTVGKPLGGLGHNHTYTLSPTGTTFTGTSLSLAVKYVDIILARRN